MSGLCPPTLILAMVLSLVLSLPALCSPWASNPLASTTSSIRRDLSFVPSPDLSPEGQACFSNGPAHMSARSPAGPLQVQVQTYMHMLSSLKPDLFLNSIPPTLASTLRNHTVTQQLPFLKGCLVVTL